MIKFSGSGDIDVDNIRDAIIQKAYIIVDDVNKNFYTVHFEDYHLGQLTVEDYVPKDKFQNATLQAMYLYSHGIATGVARQQLAVKEVLGL